MMRVHGGCWPDSKAGSSQFRNLLLDHADGQVAQPAQFTKMESLCPIAPKIFPGSLRDQATAN